MENTTADAGANWLLLGFSVNELLLAGLALLVGIAGRYLFAETAHLLIGRLTARTETTLDDRMGEALTPPLTLLPVALGVFFASQALNLSGMSASIAASVAQTLFALTVFWALLRLVDPVSDALTELRATLTPSMVQWFTRATRVLIWLIGGATILELWGVRVLPIVAGLGLIGVAVALGAQDLFKNLISGLLILGEKRFCQGDWVKVSGVVEGTVEEIGFRSTKIRQFDKAPVYVPNASFADAAVVNFGEMTHRRISWTLGLEYRTSAETLSKIRDRVEALIVQDERYLPAGEAPLLVRLDAFADSSINLMVYCFTRTRNWAEWLAIKEELLLQVKRIVEEEGAGFAFPSTSIYLEQVPEGLDPSALGGARPANGSKTAAASADPAKSGAKSGPKGAAKKPSAAKSSSAKSSSQTKGSSQKASSAADRKSEQSEKSPPKDGTRTDAAASAAGSAAKELSPKAASNGAVSANMDA